MGLLLKALVEAEIDGVAVSNHLTALKDIIDSLSKVNVIPKCPFEHTIKDSRVPRRGILITLSLISFRTRG